MPHLEKKNGVYSTGKKKSESRIGTNLVYQYETVTDTTPEGPQSASGTKRNFFASKPSSWRMHGAVATSESVPGSEPRTSSS